MYALSSAALDSLYRSHTMVVRCDIYSPAGNILNLPIAGGEVQVDAGSQVRRTATLSADPAFWPDSPTDLLAPFGSEAKLFRGVRFSRTRVEYAPLGVFTLDETSRVRPAADKGDLTVSLSDRSQRIADDRPDAPTQTISGNTVAGEITRLIRLTLGVDQEVIDRTGSTQVCPVTEYEGSPWELIEKLADSIAAEVFFDVLGRAIIRPQPTLTDSPVWTVMDGQLGNLVKIIEKLTRKTVYNRIIASGQRSDNTPPVYAVSTDTDLRSPTYYGGPFGRRPYRYSSPLLTTVAQCQSTADALLARTIGAGYSIDLEALVNPALDAGDVMTRVVDGVARNHILDKFNVPLAPDGTQQLGTRSDSLPTDEA